MSRVCLARFSRYVPFFRAATHDPVRLTGVIIYDLPRRGEGESVAVRRTPDFSVPFGPAGTVPPISPESGPPRPSAPGVSGGVSPGAAGYRLAARCGQRPSRIADAAASSRAAISASSRSVATCTAAIAAGSRPFTARGTATARSVGITSS